MIEEAVKKFSAVKGYGPDRFDPWPGDPGVPIFDRNRRKTFYHSGDIGDIIYALPTIRALGGGDLILGPEMKQDVKTSVRQAMTPRMVDMLKPLLVLQDYVKSVRFARRMPQVDIDLNKFREELVIEADSFRRTGSLLNLAETHLKRFRLNLRECQTPWLVVDEARQAPKRPVIFHRSSRWRNLDFPWDQVVKRYLSKAVFVGLQDEHAAFCEEWGSLPYAPVRDFLEMARLIAGCELFVGNQSFPYSLAEALKKTSLLEVWPDGPNCLFERPNANYGLGKNVYIPNLRFSMVEEKLTGCPMCGDERATRLRNKADIVGCGGCGFIYLRTRMSAASMVEHYQTYADGDSHMRLPKAVDEVRTSGLRRDYFMQELLEEVERNALIPHKGRMLDVGSGWGAWLANARNKGFDVTGVEICAKMADFANSVLGIDTRTDQLEDCGFRDGAFDVVTMIHSLEHLPNPKKVWQTVHRILNDGGVFCGIVPNITSFCSSKQKDEWMWLDPNMHYAHYEERTLRDCLKVFGFAVIKIYTAVGDYDPKQVAKLIQAESKVPISDEEMKERIETLCKDGQGEELRWFAWKT